MRHFFKKTGLLFWRNSSCFSALFETTFFFLVFSPLPFVLSLKVKHIACLGRLMMVVSSYCNVTVEGMKKGKWRKAEYERTQVLLVTGFTELTDSQLGTVIYGLIIPLSASLLRGGLLALTDHQQQTKDLRRTNHSNKPRSKTLSCTINLIWKKGQSDFSETTMETYKQSACYRLDGCL